MASTTNHPPFEAYSGDEPFLFVSYAHKDSAEVFPELVALRGMGVRIWYDEGIDPGNEWPEEIEAALKKSAMFLVFITPNAVASQNVRNEINFALNNHIPFLAVHLSETELVKGLALRMGDIQAVLKHRMSPESYWRKMEKVMPVELREVPEPEPVSEEEPEPTIMPQRTWQQPSPALSAWQRVLQLPRRPLLIGAAILGAIVWIANLSSGGKTDPNSRSASTPTPPPIAAATPSPPPAPTASLAATKDSPWTNTLGMKFVPSGTPGVLMSIWETRVQDYAKFAEETKREVETPKFPQGPTHPVVNVSYLDAVAFCEWLSKKEGKTYRLPTDAEWSTAVGLTGETGATPKDKHLKAPGYPWGPDFPPPRNAGNFADATAKKANSGLDYIDGYDDGFAYTSPAGTFAQNSLSIYDLSGNVWEWCDDWFDTDKDSRTLRGGSWLNADPEYMRSSSRADRAPASRNLSGLGFRCVVGVAGSGR